MNDIVERLKSWDRCYPGNINIENAVDEAAAEITRLRAELEEVTKHRDALWGKHSNERADRYWEARWRDEAAENDVLRAEIVKLREKAHSFRPRADWMQFFEDAHAAAIRESGE